MENREQRILLGMSGGVDSTGAALYLARLGYTVEGAYLRMFDAADPSCAERAAEQLGIPLHILDCREAFCTYVKNDFISEYAAGRTPNPCVRCNRYVKIKYLCDKAEELGFAHVATGHYAKVAYDDEHGRWYIKRAVDAKKDQSYALWGLNQKQLSMLILPLAEENKSHLYAFAESRKLDAAQEKESQDICFLPNGDYAAFVEAQIGAFPQGNFVDTVGNVLGKHRGIIHYTVGQRRGLGISSPGGRLFVQTIDRERNEVVLSNKDCFKNTLFCNALQFQKLACLPQRGRFLVKIRYAAEPSIATVSPCGDGAEVLFDKPVRAVTPGQSCVFYDANGSDICFGGLIAR